MRDRGNVGLADGAPGDVCPGKRRGRGGEFDQVLLLAFNDVGEIWAGGGPSLAIINGDSTGEWPIFDQEAICTTLVVDAPFFVVGGRCGDDVGCAEREGDVVQVFVEDSFLVRAVGEIGIVVVHGVGEAHSTIVVPGVIFGVEHFFRLVDPGAGALGAGDVGCVVVAAPEDEGFSVIQTGLEIAAEGFAAAQVDHRRRTGVTSEGFGSVGRGVDAAGVVVGQAGDAPAALAVGVVGGLFGAGALGHGFGDPHWARAVGGAGDGGGL